MEITTATPKDYQWINEQYLQIEFLPSDFKKDFVVIAKINNKPVGMGRLVPIDERSSELGGMFVKPEHRKKGIAGQIVKHLIDKQTQKL